jgi:hypothetical protein
MRPLEAGPGGLRRLLRDTDNVFDQWLKLKHADSVSCKIDSATVDEQFADFHRRVEEVKKGPAVSPLKSLAVNGDDLLALGIPQGRRIGEILRALHERVLDDPELNVKEKLLALVETIK